MNYETSTTKETADKIVALLDGLKYNDVHNVLNEAKSRLNANRGSSKFVSIASLPDWEDKLLTFHTPQSRGQYRLNQTQE